MPIPRNISGFLFFFSLENDGVEVYFVIHCEDGFEWDCCCDGFGGIDLGFSVFVIGGDDGYLESDGSVGQEGFRGDSVDGVAGGNASGYEGYAFYLRDVERSDLVGFNKFVGEPLKNAGGGMSVTCIVEGCVFVCFFPLEKVGYGGFEVFFQKDFGVGA